MRGWPQHPRTASLCRASAHTAADLLIIHWLSPSQLLTPHSLQVANGYGAAAAGYANGYANGGGTGAAVAEATPSAQHQLPAGKQSFKLSTEEYRQAHTLVVEGHDVPAPLQDFESVGFPRAIMDEVHLRAQPSPPRLLGRPLTLLTS